MKSQKIKGKIHRVFQSRNEFEEYFRLNHSGVVPKLVKNWREGRQGDWVVADDGGIVQILKWGPLPHPNDRKNYKNHQGWCRTVVGSFIQKDSYSMDTDFERHPNRYRFNSKSNLEQIKFKKNRKYLTNPEVEFCAAIAGGKSLQESYEAAFGPKTDWRRRAIALLRKDLVMEKIQENVKDIAKQLGIDIQFILKGLASLFESSEIDSVRLGALKELSEHIGMKDKQKSVTHGELHLYSGFKSEELEDIERERLEAMTEAEEVQE